MIKITVTNKEQRDIPWIQMWFLEKETSRTQQSKTCITWIYPWGDGKTPIEDYSIKQLAYVLHTRKAEELFQLKETKETWQWNTVSGPTLDAVLERGAGEGGVQCYKGHY